MLRLAIADIAHGKQPMAMRQARSRARQYAEHGFGVPVRFSTLGSMTGRPSNELRA
jgi:hypothetical protein